MHIHAVAFLLQDLMPQQVFAFLPLRTFGFRFVVQGDFDLPSAREDVNSDSPWNQWLREQIPLLFKDALLSCSKVVSQNSAFINPNMTIQFLGSFRYVSSSGHCISAPVHSS